MKEEVDVDEKKVPKIKFALKQFKHLKPKKKKKEHGAFSRYSDTSGGFSFMKTKDKKNKTVIENIKKILRNKFIIICE